MEAPIPSPATVRPGGVFTSNVSKRHTAADHYSPSDRLLFSGTRPTPNTNMLPFLNLRSSYSGNLKVFPDSCLRGNAKLCGACRSCRSGPIEKHSDERHERLVSRTTSSTYAEKYESLLAFPGTVQLNAQHPESQLISKYHRTHQHGSFYRDGTHR